jgi:hypothetical protein
MCRDFLICTGFAVKFGWKEYQASNSEKKYGFLNFLLIILLFITDHWGARSSSQLVRRFCASVAIANLETCFRTHHHSARPSSQLVRLKLVSALIKNRTYLELLHPDPNAWKMLALEF